MQFWRLWQGQVEKSTSSPVRSGESVPDELSKPSPDGEIIIRSFAASRSPPCRLSCPERRTFIQFQYCFINLNQTFIDLQIWNFKKNQNNFPKHLVASESQIVSLNAHKWNTKVAPLKGQSELKEIKSTTVKGLCMQDLAAFAKKIINRTQFLPKDPKYHSNDIYTVVSPFQGWGIGDAMNFCHHYFCNRQRSPKSILLFLSFGVLSIVDPENKMWNEVTDWPQNFNKIFFFISKHFLQLIKMKMVCLKQINMN